jgi:hypothetical protein
MQSVIAEKIDTYTRHPWHELSMSTVILSFLDNHRHLSSPVSIFRTVSTPITLCKGRKHFAPRIGDDDFRGGSPLLMLCMSTVFLSFLDNHRALLSPVSIFRTGSTHINLCKGRKHSAARSGDGKFRGCSILLTRQQDHSVSQFSRQSLSAIEYRFDFPDQCNIHKHMQRPKTLRRSNRRLLFCRCVWVNHISGPPKA